MQKINDAFDQIIALLEATRDEIAGEFKFELDDLTKQKDEVAKVRKANTEKAKKLKEQETGMAANLARIEEGEARIRKDEELTKYQEKLDEDIAKLAKREKFVEQKEQEVVAKLEEVKARELKLLEKERTYKEKIEQDFLGRFLKK